VNRSVFWAPEHADHEIRDVRVDDVNELPKGIVRRGGGRRRSVVTKG
jgi:hypothetical protein